MSYRFMRVLVMFDLPTVMSNQRKSYRNFRKYLIKSGFLMMQESVYSKLALNQSSASIVVKNIEKNKPSEGLVQVLIITEKQFSSMKTIVGDVKSDVIDSDERLLIL
ncbi:CRISPR-associated endonuclease Cas2 [Peptostreptococcus russellii]|uniref:CRISPR-associated endonuclease Cas2 n=1 Tax=Peptostreptococcus russellii TaxID=215200 RepID=UPI003F58B773